MGEEGTEAGPGHDIARDRGIRIESCPMSDAVRKDYVLSDLLPSERIIELEVTDKKLALQRLLDVLAETGAVARRVEVEQAIFSREVLMSTGVGYGIAVPHAKLGIVDDFAIALGICPAGIAYSSEIDELPVKLICMIVGPAGHQENYLRILGMLMRFLKSEKGKILSAFSLSSVHTFTAGYDTSNL